MMKISFSQNNQKLMRIFVSDYLARNPNPGQREISAVTTRRSSFSSTLGRLCIRKKGTERDGLTS